MQELATCSHLASGRVPSVRLFEQEGQPPAPKSPYYGWWDYPERWEGLVQALLEVEARWDLQVAVMRYNAAAQMRLTRAVDKLEYLREPCYGPARRTNACTSTMAKARIPGQQLLRRRTSLRTVLLVRTPLTGSLSNVSEAC